MKLRGSGGLDTEAHGVFTVTYRATDFGGDHEASPARTVVTVR